MSRELEAAIAKALGYEVEFDLGWDWLYKPDGERAGLTNIPAYSIKSDAMLELDAEMRKRGYDLSLRRHVARPPWEYEKRIYSATYYSKEFPKTGNPTKHAETEPLARALAAYHALTGKEYEEENRGGKVSE